jgi:phage baseplate assembly protein W
MGMVMPEAIESKPYEHLGRGWAFPLQLNVQGGVQLSAAHPNIAESIRIILNTRLGERVYRPDFGSRLSELVFSPLSTDTLLLSQIYVEEALNKWEPRIVLDQVVTQPEPERGRIAITIHYRPKASADRHSLVYPFYLTPAEA